MRITPKKRPLFAGVTQKKLPPLLYSVIGGCAVVFILGSFFSNNGDASSNYGTLLSIQANHKQNTLTYSAALFTLRCLTTPGCFSSLACRTGIPQRVQRKKKWEEQAFCVDDLVAARSNNNNACLVYSVGIYNSYEWEEKVARLFGCQVHAFDPTMDHPTDLAPGVTFHKLGLEAAGTNMSATHSDLYNVIDESKLLPLDAILTKLRHSHVDLLMLDCEGCEWGVLRALMCDKVTQAHKKIGQIVVEMHFQRNLGLLNEADVLAAAQAVHCMDEARWGIVSIEQSGIGKEDADYTTDVTKVLHGASGGFLLNVALQRIPDDEPLPHERVESIATFSKDWYKERMSCFDAHGSNPANWPVYACPKYRLLDTQYNKMLSDYRAVTKERVRFDQHPRIDEGTWKIPSV